MNLLYITFFRKYNKEAGEDTHYTKRSITILQHHSEGRTPIIKNISVIDAQGNEYEATWPKRAKGLVKNGRARFVNETTICLACPPENTEADFMNMENPDHQDELFHVLQKHLRRDPVKAKAVDITPLHILEMTRKKVRKPVIEELRELR